MSNIGNNVDKERGKSSKSKKAKIVTLSWLIAQGYAQKIAKDIEGEGQIEKKLEEEYGEIRSMVNEIASQVLDRVKAEGINLRDKWGQNKILWMKKILNHRRKVKKTYRGKNTGVWKP